VTEKTLQCNAPENAKRAEDFLIVGSGLWLDQQTTIQDLQDLLVECHGVK
jgi:hypothetical protein